MSEILDWETTLREICEKGYTRLFLFCKLNFIDINLKEFLLFKQCLYSKYTGVLLCGVYL